MDLSESMELTGQKRNLVLSWARAMENSFVGQGNASVLILQPFDKGLGLAPAHWAFGYALNVRLEKFSHLNACQ